MYISTVSVNAWHLIITQRILQNLLWLYIICNKAKIEYKKKKVNFEFLKNCKAEISCEYKGAASVIVLVAL